MVKQFVFELKREIIHICIGLAIIWLAMNYAHAEWVLFGILIAGLAISFLSLYFKIPIIWQMLQIFERKHYLRTFPGKGVIFYIAGCLLALKLFLPETAYASIAILAFGDSFSHLAGKVIRTKDKEIESIIIGMVIATFAAQFFIGWILAFTGAAIAMAAEFIGIKLGQDNVDDNFFIPLVAGTAIYVASKILAVIF